MDYVSPSGSLVADEDYIGKTASQAGSKIPPKVPMNTQREIVRAIKAAALTPTNADIAQLAQAISRGIHVNFGAVANVLALQVPGAVVFPALLPGMKFYGFVQIANTGAVNAVVTGFGTGNGTYPVKRPDGTALAAGDLLAGGFVELIVNSAATGFICPNAAGGVLAVIQSQFLITGAVEKTVGSGGGYDFSTLSAATLWASKYLVTQGGSLALSMAAGQHQFVGATTLLNHVNADRITIQGAALLGAPPSYANLIVSGPGSTARSNDAIANLAILRAIYATEIRYSAASGNVTQGGLAVAGRNPTLVNLLITSDATGTQAGGANGLTIDGGAICKNVAVHGFGGAGILIRNSTLTVPSGFALTVSACGAAASGGIDVQQGGQLLYAGAVQTVGCGCPGLHAVGGSVQRVGGAIACAGNALDGASIVTGASFDGQNGVFVKNGGNGVYGYLARVDVSSAQAGGNTGFGLAADNAEVVARGLTFPTSNTAGTIYAVGPSGRVDAQNAAVNGNESPAVNGAGGLSANGGAYIRN